MRLGAAFEFFAFFWSNSRPLELQNSSNYLMKYPHLRIKNHAMTYIKRKHGAIMSEVGKCVI